MFFLFKDLETWSDVKGEMRWFACLPKAGYDSNIVVSRDTQKGIPEAEVVPSRNPKAGMGGTSNLKRTREHDYNQPCENCGCNKDLLSSWNAI